MQTRFTEGDDLAEERAYVQPPIALPPAAELTEAAARSEIVRQLTALADWVGADGCPLTQAGNLRVVDARELTTVLGTGEERFQVRSATELPRLTLLLAWAKSSASSAPARAGCSGWPRRHLSCAIPGCSVAARRSRPSSTSAR